jgi:hypothetical protein
MKKTAIKCLIFPSFRRAGSLELGNVPSDACYSVSPETKTVRLVFWAIGLFTKLGICEIDTLSQDLFGEQFMEESS